MLSGEIGEIVELAFNFLDARLQDGKGRRRRHSQIRLVHGDPWLRNAILSERQRLLQLLQVCHARVELGLKIGGSIRIPRGIVEARLVGRKRGLGRLNGGWRLLDRFRRCLSDDGYQTARARSWSISSFVQTFLA